MRIDVVKTGSINYLLLSGTRCYTKTRGEFRNTRKLLLRLGTLCTSLFTMARRIDYGGGGTVGGQRQERKSGSKDGVPTPIIPVSAGQVNPIASFPLQVFRRQFGKRSILRQAPAYCFLSFLQPRAITKDVMEGLPMEHLLHTISHGGLQVAHP